MTLHIHHLTGCSPAPLAHYLKGLGILRLVAQQADPDARGCWQDEHFCLVTKLDRKALEQFFLEEYEPTPFVSPWNKGSGFYQSNDPGMSPLEDSKAERFAIFRAGIAAGRRELIDLAQADQDVRALKNQTKAKKGMTQREKDVAHALNDDPDFKRERAVADKRFTTLKADVFTPCQLKWRGPHREWMEAAVVLDASGAPTFPSLLGTGGNDGRLDFTNNAMQHLGKLFDLDDPTGKPLALATPLLHEALWAQPANGLISSAIGQFLPGSAGGANSTTAADGSPLINPWDFILMIEGTILFTARSTRRLDPQSVSCASSPFVLYAQAVGHFSPGDENAQCREQWMPLWSRPCTLGDLSAMLGEARLQVGRQTASRPVDAARAIARLGVARGINAFTRYGYLKRNGKSNMAVPLGRIAVQYRPRTRLIDDLAPWLDRLQRQARDKNAPNRLVQAERRLTNAVLGVLTHDESADRWQDVLRSAVAIEAIQAGGTAIEAGPIPRLRPDWLEATDDGSTERRLAMAMGSAAAGYKNRKPFDPIRHHWLPLDEKSHRFKTHDQRLAHDARVVMHGRDALTDLTSLVQRRFIDANMSGDESRRLPLVAAPGYEARLSDIALLLAGYVNLDRVSQLARSFMAVDWLKALDEPFSKSKLSDPRPDEAWLMLRLACLPWPLDENHDIHAEPAMIRRLLANDGGGAVTIARRRLQSTGIRPPLSGALVDKNIASLWAAALAFPISHNTARYIAHQLDPSFSWRPS